MAIEDVFSEARSLVNEISPDTELHDFEEVTQSKTPGLVRTLSIAGVIRTTQGTSKVYFQNHDPDESSERVDRMETAVTQLVVKLKNDPSNSIPKSDVVATLESNGFSESEYYHFVSLLSQANVAVSSGKGRVGGIQLYQDSIDAQEIEVAIEDIASGVTAEEKEEKESEHEEILYPAAAKLVSEMGFQAITLGKARRLPGEWNTPDIVGYRVNRFSVLGGAEIEVITVEVKWSMSKQAIAETGSHQRVSHQSYLMVYQRFDSLDAVHLSQLADRGIGLITWGNDAPKFHWPAALNRPAKVDVDDFISIALEPEEVSSVKDEIAKALVADSLAIQLKQSGI